LIQSMPGLRRPPNPSDTSNKEEIGKNCAALRAMQRFETLKYVADDCAI
jgi:hypothetical protein